MNARIETFSPHKWLFYIAYAYKHPHKALPRLRFKIKKLINPEYPCWASGAVDFLQAHLSLNDTVGEFGSGQSSLWLSRRVKAVYSVEHEPKWFNYLNATVKRKKITNLCVLLANEDPISYVATMEQNVPPLPLDCLIIDGKFRKECASSAKSLVRKGGLVVLDDTNRKEYEPFLHLLGKPVRRFDEGVRCTDTFVCE